MYESDRRIVAALAELERDRDALHWAAAEAAVRGRPLHIVHAYEWRPGAVWPTRLRSVPDSLLAEARAAADRLLAEAAAEVRARRPGLAVTTGALEGAASPALQAESHTAELLVLGSPGRAGWGSALGGVVRAIAERSGCPVVLVRDHPAPTARPRVVVGLDLSCDSDPLLAFSFEAAYRHRASLEAVTCWHPDLLDAETVPELTVAGDEAAVEGELCDELAPWTRKFPDIDTIATVSERRPVPGLIERSAGQQLLVLGRPVSHPVRALLGSVHLAALGQAGCPVALVPLTGTR